METETRYFPTIEEITRMAERLPMPYEVENDNFDVEGLGLIRAIPPAIEEASDGASPVSQDAFLRFTIQFKKKPVNGGRDAWVYEGPVCFCVY